MELMEIPNIPC